MKRLTVTRKANDNSFCGPAAISIITGKPVSEITEQLRRNRGYRTTIRGVANWEIISVLQYYGHFARQIELSIKRPTVAQFIKRLQSALSLESGINYLVNTTGHYVVIRGRKIIYVCGCRKLSNGRYEYVCADHMKEIGMEDRYQVEEKP